MPDSRVDTSVAALAAVRKFDNGLEGMEDGWCHLYCTKSSAGTMRTRDTKRY